MIRHACGLLATGVLVVACSAVPGVGDRGQAAAAPPALSATVWRSRPDEAAGHRLQVKLTNETSDPVTVTAVRLRDHGFVEVAATPKDVTFPAGRRFDLPVPVGTARCPAAPVTAPRVEVGWRTPDGRTGVVVLVATVQDDVLTRARREECAQAQVARIVLVSLAVDARQVAAAPPGGGTGATVPVTLRLRRRDDDAGPVRVLGLDGSVLFDLAPAPGTRWPQTLPAGGAALDVPLRLAAATCDGHRLGEAKKPYVFPAFVEVDPAVAPVAVVVTVDETTRDLPAGLLRTVCDSG